MPDTMHEVVGVFTDLNALDAAVTELQSQGFNRADLSISRIDANERRASALRAVRDIEDDPGAPRTVFVSKVSLGDAEGALIGGFAYVAAVAAAAVAVAEAQSIPSVVWTATIAGLCGGLLGYLLARRIEGAYARRLGAQFGDGGVVLWVHVRDAAQERRAGDIFAKHRAGDMHAHDVPALRFTPEAARGGVSYDLSFMNRLGL